MTNNENENTLNSKHEAEESLWAEAENYVPEKPSSVDSETVEETTVEEFAYIGGVTDVSTQAVKETLTPGGPFCVSGYKIKVAGNNPDVGVYFVSAADPSQRVKVQTLAKNTDTRVSGTVPALSAGSWKLEIVTQYISIGGLLEEPRTIAFDEELTVIG